MTRVWLAALVAGSLLGYVLPGERVLLQLQTLREKNPPLRVEARLFGEQPDWPERVRFELHPDFGVRISEERGGRWLVRGGRVVAASGASVPEWIPGLEILVLRSEAALRGWLDQARIDFTVNQLARCGEADCFVVGGRRAERQLWIDKDRFEVLRWVASRRGATEFEGWRDWDRQRFPAAIRIHDRDQVFAEFSVESVALARDLSESDFAPEWARAAPPTH
ncbi:MAG: hypothetical protein JRG76_08430 [Deltaproteobacteria bacterium]|nr:hypothetical protein [Deltaproteobacteria bacterium]MBW2414521.1 hypothetical protein [Deltaproteobacteria bacterium]